MTEAQKSPPKTSKLEFDVQMSCNSCADVVRKALEEKNIHNFDIDLQKEKVIVETDMPYMAVLNALESTGKMATLKGYGSSVGQSAVCEIREQGGILGVVRFSQLDDGTCIIDGTIDGLTEQQMHHLAIHEFGDLTNGCESVGEVHNPGGFKQPYGNLGEILPDSEGHCMFRKENAVVKVPDIIGRSLVVSGGVDNNLRLGCGIIARSAGLFQNPKRICQCDGKTIWEERTQARSKY